MATRAFHENQPFSISLANAQDGRRDFELEAIIVRWADMILNDQQGMTKRQRDSLHDIKRRASSVNRSPLARLAELSRFSSVRAATFGPEMLRGMIVANLDVTLPAVDVAYESEEDANHIANVRQQRFREHRSLAHAEEVCEAFAMQEFASRIAADSTYRAMQSRSIVVARR